MRVVVASCWKYRDASAVCLELLRRFWPEVSPVLITDTAENPRSWCDVVAEYAANCTEPILLILDDLFINAPVRKDLVDHALQQFVTRKAGMVRLYPCDGANASYGDDLVGVISKGTPYRISSLTGIWRPEYLEKIARQFTTAWDFEIQGTKLAESMPEEILAWKRDATPWPIEHFTTAITRGVWEPAALEFCRKQGIAVDTSMREVQSPS